MTTWLIRIMKALDKVAGTNGFKFFKNVKMIWGIEGLVGRKGRTPKVKYSLAIYVLYQVAEAGIAPLQEFISLSKETCDILHIVLSAITVILILLVCCRDYLLQKRKQIEPDYQLQNDRQKLKEVLGMNTTKTKIEKFVCLQMMIAIVILMVTDDVKVRLYAPANRKISWSNGKVAMSWVSSIHEAKNRAKGAAIVSVEIPRSLLANIESVYFERGRFNVYGLRGSALRYAKRSCRPA
jgi:hypothetical protein